MSELFSKIHNHLPVFSIVYKRKNIIYTPGFYIVVERTPGNSLKKMVNNPSQIENAQFRNSINGLLAVSQDSVNAWEKRKTEPFIPECLTIHVGNECNLNCDYCYSKIGTNSKLKGFPAIKDIESAFHYLLSNGGVKTKKTTVVYHGSGEPTYFWNKLVSAYDHISQLAQKNDITVFNYLATNGILNEEQISWLANNMDQIGISCDGPYQIHTEHRKINEGDFRHLEKTCRLLHDKKARYSVRSTITPQTMTKQVDIVKYLIHDLYATQIRFEPVYLFENGFEESQVPHFIDCFLEARSYAMKKGAYLEFSGVRLNELHSTYCDISRNTLRLTSEGIFRNCFCKFHDNNNFNVGWTVKNHKGVVLNPTLKEIKDRAFEIPQNCKNCINIFHCSRGCPDFCFFDELSNQGLIDFKCKLHQLFSVSEIKQLVDNNFA